MASNIQLFNMDCMEAMAKMPDKAFELAIVDPPYGIGDRLVDGAGKDVMKKYKEQYYKKRWDIVPDASFFAELRRVSINQIIWGGNYFDLPPTRGIICWDKKQMMPTFSRWEYAWSSFDKPAKMFEKHGNDIDRTHVTQKPVKLYEWLLKNYAKPGDKILDTHLGSGSIAIACHNMGFALDGYELDKDYFEAAVKRLENHKRQGTLFEPKEIHGF